MFTYPEVITSIPWTLAFLLAHIMMWGPRMSSISCSSWGLANVLTYEPEIPTNVPKIFVLFWSRKTWLLISFQTLRWVYKPLGQKKHIQNSHQFSYRMRVRNLKFPPCCSCLFPGNDGDIMPTSKLSGGLCRVEEIHPPVCRFGCSCCGWGWLW